MMIERQDPGSAQGHRVSRPLLGVTLAVSVFLLVYGPIDLIYGYLRNRREAAAPVFWMGVGSKVRMSSDLFHHGMQPMARQQETFGDLSYTLVTNSLGFKDRSERMVAPVPDRYRIVFMGDSFTEGIGLPFEETFVGMLSDRLGSRGIEVLNAGVVSYSPKLMFLKLDHLLRQQGLRFDELALFIDCSDAIDEIDYSPFRQEELRARALVPQDATFREVCRGAEKWYEHSLLYRTILRLGPRTDPWKRTLYENTATGRRIAYHDNRGEWPHEQRWCDDWASEGLRSASFHVERILDLGREFGFRVTLAIYPWPREIMVGLTGSRNVLFWSRFCESHGVPLMNLYPAFADGAAAAATVKDLFLKGDVHWNRVGHAAVADAWLARRCQVSPPLPAGP